MPVIPRVDITAEDLREESIRQGFDPDKWVALQKSDGYWHIHKGMLSVGHLIFEDHAKILVEALNMRGKK